MCIRDSAFYAPMSVYDKLYDVDDFYFDYGIETDEPYKVCLLYTSLGLRKLQESRLILYQTDILII